MQHTFFTVAVLLVVAVLLAQSAAAAAGHPGGEVVHHHSLEPPFIEDWWQEGVPHWDVGGDAVVTDKFVRLTPQRPSRFGWAWNSQPNDNPWWELSAKVLVHSQRNPGADGIAFWYVDNPYKGATPGPLFGMTNQFRGIGILLDSYDNDNMRDNPATLFIENIEGTRTHWQTDKDLLHEARFRCMFEHRNTLPEDPVELLVTYIHKKITVRLRSELRNVDTYCGEMNIDLPQNWYFGVTATTGHLVDNHDLVSFRLRPLGDGSVGNPQIPIQLEHFDHGHERNEKTYWEAGESGASHHPPQH